MQRGSADCHVRLVGERGAEFFAFFPGEQEVGRIVGGVAVVGEGEQSQGGNDVDDFCVLAQDSEDPFQDAAAGSDFVPGLHGLGGGGEDGGTAPGAEVSADLDPGQVGGQHPDPGDEAAALGEGHELFGDRAPRQVHDGEVAAFFDQCGSERGEQRGPSRLGSSHGGYPLGAFGDFHGIPAGLGLIDAFAVLPFGVSGGVFFLALPELSFSAFLFRASFRSLPG